MQPITKWYDGDLKKRALLAMRYAEQILNPEADNAPYFAYTRDPETGEGFGHGWYSSMPHAVGRAMDLMLTCEKFLGERLAPSVEETYIRLFYKYLDPDYGMCIEWREENGYQIEPHNVRETIEALALLIELRRDPRAVAAVEKLFAGFALAIDKEQGGFSVELARANGILHRFSGNLAAPQPQTAGRLTGPLMKLYRVTNDARALDYAGCFARGTLACFDDDGVMLRAAGTHIHSITSSLSGAADYAIFMKDSAMTAKLKRLYTHPQGLGQVMASTGWVKEQIHVEGEKQGECNQFGDRIQFQLAFAAHEDSAWWYAQAETCMRGALLPAQVLRHDFVKASSPGGSDDHHRIEKRILGGFGFPMPGAHLQKEGSCIDTLDITQGACQAICVFREHIVTKTADGAAVNLLFSHDSPYALVTSGLPVTGRVDILPKFAGRLSIRLPSAFEEGSLVLSIDGEPAAYTLENGYAVLEVERLDAVAMTFLPARQTLVETILDAPHTIVKWGEQVIGITPRDGLYPLYDDADFSEQ